MSRADVCRFQMVHRILTRPSTATLYTLACYTNDRTIIAIITCYYAYNNIEESAIRHRSLFSRHHRGIVYDTFRSVAHTVKIMFLPFFWSSSCLLLRFSPTTCGTQLVDRTGRAAVADLSQRGKRCRPTTATAPRSHRRGRRHAPRTYSRNLIKFRYALTLQMQLLCINNILLLACSSVQALLIRPLHILFALLVSTFYVYFFHKYSTSLTHGKTARLSLRTIKTSL